MNRTTKIILGIVGGVVVLCCGIGALGFFLAPSFLEDFATESFADTPQEAAAVGQEIIDYELPSNFQEDAGMELLGIKMVMITSSDMAISIMEFPAAMKGNEAQMESQMQQQFSTQGGSNNSTVSFEAVGTQDVEIGGETRTLTIMEGSDENGDTQRMIQGFFESKSGGPSMLMIMGPADSWDDAGIQQFLDSLR